MTESEKDRVDWCELHKSVKGGQLSENPNEILEMSALYMPYFRDTLNEYVAKLRTQSERADADYDDDNNNNINNSPVFTKETLLEIRAALRFLLVLMNDEERRPCVQNDAILGHGCHKPLCDIIKSPVGDFKTRTIASKLLSNTITCNPDASRCLSETLALSPSDADVSARLLNSISASEGVGTPIPTTTASQQQKLTWVDLILGCARTGNRDALGVVVATLHNTCSQHKELAVKVATDSILISNLLRQMLPAKQVVTGSDQEDDKADSATEWISLFIEKLCREGLLELMYNGISSSSVTTPEHLVLLHCLSNAVEEFMDPSASFVVHPLGGEDEPIVNTHFFLAKTAIQIRSAIEENTPSNQESSDAQLQKSTLVLILDILATSLGNDREQSIDKVRLVLGSKTTLLQSAAIDMGHVVDVLLEQSSGRAARELRIAEEEQKWITTLVRLLGNLSFRCKQNQNMMRTSMVPFLREEARSNLERSALHVMLSCTSLAHGCFTLREWSIVALRNILEDNEENQSLVEQLEAQQPLQSSELEKMGMKVEMDARGKVKVIPKETN